MHYRRGIVKRFKPIIEVKKLEVEFIAGCSIFNPIGCRIIQYLIVQILENIVLKSVKIRV